MPLSNSWKIAKLLHHSSLELVLTKTLITLTLNSLLRLSILLLMISEYSIDRIVRTYSFNMVVVLICSGVLAKIDQGLFEGFEYVNPLMMSKVDD